MKRIISVLISSVLLFWCVLPAGATHISNELSLTDEITFETVTLGDNAMTVPVIIEDVNSGTRSANSIGMRAQQATYYIPVTEEGQEYNEKYIASAYSGTATYSKPDPNQYFTVTTYIRFTMYPEDSIPDVYVSIDNVAITRTQEPTAIEWDILGIETPKVQVSQRGVSKEGGISSYLAQVTDFMTVQWGLTGVNTPSDWVPVLCQSYSDVCITNAVFEFYITYSTTGRRLCRVTHPLPT